MLHIYFDTFISLFVVINPVAIILLFIELTQKFTANERKKIASKACLISAILLIFFSFIGDWLLKLMGISDAAFQIAGGFLLLITAIEMVAANHTGMTMTTPSEEKEVRTSRDIAVFPLAIPLIAGPGALMTVILFMKEAESYFFQQLIVIGIILTVIGLTYLFLRAAALIQKVIGITGSNVVTRVFGIILMALATQFILSGIKNALF